MDAITFVPSLPMGMILGKKVAKQNQSKEIVLRNKFHNEMAKIMPSSVTKLINQEIVKPIEAKFNKIKNMFNLEYLIYNRDTHHFTRKSARKLRVNEIVTNNTRVTRNDIESSHSFVVIEGIKEVPKVEVPERQTISEPVVSNPFDNKEFGGINTSFEVSNNLSRVSRLNNNELYNSEPVNEKIARQVDLNVNKSSQEVMEQYNSLMHSSDNPDLIDIDLAREENKVDLIKRENDEKRRLVIEAKARIEQLEKAHKLKAVKEELLEQTTEYNSLTQELAALQEREEELRNSIRM